MNYYLPTTLKLLGSYQRLSAQNVKGENITSTLFNIAGMMHTVADAFEKQLDSLYAEEAMDISADITVFETLLKQEGFVDEDKQEQEERKNKAAKRRKVLPAFSKAAARPASSARRFQRETQGNSGRRPRPSQPAAPYSQKNQGG